MSNSPPTVMLIATLLVLIFPVALSFWIISLLASERNNGLPSPLRWLFSFLVPLLVVIQAYLRKHLDWTGVIIAFIIGFILTLANYCFIFSMLTFFFTSYKVTKYKNHLKRELETDSAELRRRNWLQVICNGGVATQFAILFMLERGIADENPINFKYDYYSSWFAMGVLGSIACNNGDTWGSEMSLALTRGNPRLITSLRKVPRGTNGGVTVIGLIFSALGGLAIGLAYYLTLLLCVNRDVLAISPPQWPILMVGGCAGLIGSIVDSMLGALLQYSGFDRRTGKIVEVPGENVEWVSGIRFLDNHSVNLFSSLIMALLTPRISLSFWS
ncbi:transmembrane protein 19-like [Panonychus citri]|uniref:transmembrane protein 19-like n=1 Tax=Panonychus citri TaxID=50023 RepID=UPI0023077E7B|nr:transmembrane protein 19-like [Panonychus citri]